MYDVTKSRMTEFTGLKQEYDEISDEINEAVNRVLRGGWYILGEELTSFEQEFSNYIVTK
jgi:dTDP-4-amino-4,6-dideoxygalactose transaminase